MKISKERIEYETPEFIAVSMRGKFAGFVAMIEKKKCVFSDKEVNAQLDRSVLLRPYADRTRTEVEITADEFIKEAM